MNIHTERYNVVRLFTSIILGTALFHLVYAPDEELTCDIACTRDWNPVCGDFEGIQKTFSNSCMMGYYNCRKGTDFVLLHHGECAEELEFE